jgi:PAS domain S-box-containing protein/putative nucleotidyltransferase with HDIG domain
MTKKNPDKPEANEDLALRASDQRFKTAFDNSAVGIMQAGVDGKPILVNLGFARMSGYDSVEEFMSNVKSVSDTYIDPDERLKLIRRLKKEGSISDAEYRMRRKDGSAIWISVSVKLFKDPSGAQVMQGMAVDISSRKAAEAALKASEERYKGVFENSAVGILQTNMDGVPIMVNPAFARMAGYDSVKEFLAGVRSIRDLYADPDVRDKLIKRLTKKGSIADAEVLLTRKDGQPLWVSVSIQLFQDATGETVMQGMIVDISGRKAAETALSAEEKKYRFLFDHMGQGVVVQDKEGRIVDANQAAARILGLSMDQLLGKTSFDPRWRSIHEDGSDWPGTDHPVMQAIKTGKPVPASVMGVHDTDRNEYRWVLVGAFPQFREGEKKAYQAFATFSDVSDRVLAERRSQELARMVESSNDAIVGLTVGGVITSWNAAAERLYGYSENEVLGRHISFTIPEDRKQESSRFSATLAKGRSMSDIETKRTTKDGEIIDVAISISPTFDSKGRPVGGVAIVRDITEQKRSLTALQDSEERYHSLFENMQEGFAYGRMLFDKNNRPYDWIYIDVNDSFARITGLDNVRGKEVSEVLPDLKKTNPELFEIYGRVAKTGAPEQFESFVAPLNQWLQVSVYCPKQDYFVAVFEDVTERKTNEQVLKESEERLRSIIDNAPFGAHLYRLDPDDRLVYIAGNESANRILGIDNDQFIGMTLEEAFPGNVGTELPEMYRRAARTGEPYTTQQVNYDASGISGVFEVHAVQTAPNHMVAFFQDITETSKAQMELRESEEKYRKIFTNATEGIVQSTIDGDIITVNPRFVKMLGYDSEHEFKERVRNFKSAYLNPQDRERLIERLLRESTVTNYEVQMRRRDGTPVWLSINSTLIAGEDTPQPYLESLVVDITERRLAEDEVRRLASFPKLNIMPIVEFSAEGKVRYANPAAGLLNKELAIKDPKEILPSDWPKLLRDVKAARAGFISVEVQYKERTFLEKIHYFPDFDGVRVYIVDITDRKKAEDELTASHKNLEEALLGLVSTLALTVETRDPYTAEHQKRVTELSVAIAAKAGFSKGDIEGLRMAASIHDIGKIYVPAETLNKPGKVTPVEYELIKTHSEAGYNIVKDIKFEHPIAEIILQHHERIDGSGYPNGLHGKDTRARARIVAVADVVEAMCSHRPYRPALGVDLALEEIEKNAGKLYDPDYSAICISLFRDNKFNFK